MSRRVVVIGSANVDLVWRGEHLPLPGETVTDGEFVQVLGGKGANQAAAAAALGAEVVFVGCVGDDDHGRLVRSDLEARGVDCSELAITGDAPTGVALITVDRAGENAIAVAPGANRLVPAAVGARMIRSGDVVLCSLEIPVATVEAAVAAARASDALVIVNPAPPRAAPAGAVLTPNEHECERLGGIDALLAAAPAVIVTRGGAGVTLHRAGGAIDQAAFAVDVVDTTGAGDAFNGALAWAISKGTTLEDALPLACAAAALATRAVGARSSLATEDEVYALATA
ncbi:MAG: ribokinase [Actinomycetota bacterium]|jgi:ribokinase|nr:ribokinase [Actinomycetota bacterium]